MCRLPLGAVVAAALVSLAPSAGAAAWSPSGGLAGGRVHALAVDPAAPAHAVAVVERLDDVEPRVRLYETLDAGRSWTAGASVVDGYPVGDSTTIAVADGVVWAASVASTGPCRAPSAAGPFACSATRGVFRSLVAVPGLPGVLLAAGGGLARSADGGATWTAPPGFVADGVVAPDPLVAGAVYGTTSQRVLRSVDGGLT